MLPKKFRLNADNDIKRLVRSGKTFFLPQLTLKYQKNTVNCLRIGFVVSTKVDKKAVIRNKVKRRLREAIKTELPGLKNGYDLLFIAKKACVDLSFVDLCQQLQFALKTARLYNDTDAKNTKKNWPLFGTVFYFYYYNLPKNTFPWSGFVKNIFSARFLSFSSSLFWVWSTSLGQARFFAGNIFD